MSSWWWPSHPKWDFASFSHPIFKDFFWNKKAHHPSHASSIIHGVGYQKSIQTCFCIRGIGLLMVESSAAMKSKPSLGALRTKKLVVFRVSFSRFVWDGVGNWHSFWDAQYFCEGSSFSACFTTLQDVFCLVLLVPLGIWELFKSDVLGVIHFRKLPCNLKIHPWKRWFLCWKPPLSGSTLNFGAKFFGLDKWAIRAWRWITNETRNRRSRVVVFSLRETAVDFWSLLKMAKGSDIVSNKGQTAPIASASPLRYLHPLSCPLVRSSHLWRHLAGPITCLQATVGTFSIHFQVVVSSIYFCSCCALFGEDEPILTHIFQMGWNHPDFHTGCSIKNYLARTPNIVG